ncbi:hypothetical protein ACK8GE_04495 [Micromonosporaceae bacterium DT194]|uniref:hypothetical protein n=1 Tax=Melissospora conviva TaxID=3388432 RepID=UPI003C198D35
MRRSTLRDRLWLYGAGLLVAVAVLAPLAGPGYVLGYDMVFVPRQPLRAELIAPGDALPRAVPLDALVSLATQVVPGWLLQRLLLAGILLFAAVGAGRLVPGRRRLTVLVAAVGYAWTPYLAERLLIGQWGLLLAYAALPWLVRAAIALRAGQPGALPRLVLAAVPAAVTPTGGVIAAGLTAALLLGRTRRRAAALACAAVLLLNAPWLVAALVTSADGRSDPAGVLAFAARGSDWSGVLGSLAGTGGIWNAETTLPSRASLLTPIGTLVIVVLAAYGARLLHRRWPGGVALRLAGAAAAGFLLACAPVLPGGVAALEWLVSAVPGGGLLRDGQKFLMPYALLLAVAAALGAERLADRLDAALQRSPAGASDDRLAGRSVLLGALLLPVLLMPDLAYGAGGRLRPAQYPADWDVVAARVAADPGEVLSLPLSAYRAYDWNHGRTVLDPLPRYLDADVLVDDTLMVGEYVVSGENPRMAALRAGLAAGEPVAATGVRWVVVQRAYGAGVPPEQLAGLRTVHAGPDLILLSNDAVPAIDGGDTFWPVTGACALALAVALVAISGLRWKPTAW